VWAVFDVDAAAASGLGNHDDPFPGLAPPLVPQIERARLRMTLEHFAAWNEAGRNGLGAFPADGSIVVPSRQCVPQLVRRCAAVNGYPRTVVNTRVRHLVAVFADTPNSSVELTKRVTP